MVRHFVTNFAVLYPVPKLVQESFSAVPLLVYFSSIYTLGGGNLVLLRGLLLESYVGQALGFDFYSP